MAHRFDVIHFHTGYLHLPLARRLRAPSVTTLHGRLDFDELAPMMGDFADSRSCRSPTPSGRPHEPQNWGGTVYHGLPPDLLPLRADAGRLRRVRRPHLPREACRPRDRDCAAAGVALRVAAKIDPWTGTSTARSGRCSSCRTSSYLGEIDEEEKAGLLGGARALLFPIDWPEPFGMVVIEAMSCGTPVLAWHDGSVPELLEDGVNRLDRRLDRRGGRGAAVGAIGDRPRGLPRDLRAAVHRRAHGPRLRARSTRRCARPRREARWRPGSA